MIGSCMHVVDSAIRLESSRSGLPEKIRQNHKGVAT